jgi:hypothetical protein
VADTVFVPSNGFVKEHSALCTCLSSTVRVLYVVNGFFVFEYENLACLFWQIRHNTRSFCPRFNRNTSSAAGPSYWK